MYLYYCCLYKIFFFTYSMEKIPSVFMKHPPFSENYPYTIKSALDLRYAFLAATFFQSFFLNYSFRNCNKWLYTLLFIDSFPRNGIAFVEDEQSISIDDVRTFLPPHIQFRIFLYIYIPAAFMLFLEFYDIFLLLCEECCYHWGALSSSE